MDEADQAEQGIKAGYVLRELDELAKCDDPTVIMAHLQKMADGTDPLRKAMATDMMSKARAMSGEHPAKAVRRWGAAGSVSMTTPDTDAMAAEHAKTHARNVAMDNQARRFAHSIRRAAVHGAALGAAAAMQRGNRGLEPRNPISGAPTMAADTGQHCPTCGSPMTMRKMAGAAMSPNHTGAGAAAMPANANFCPTCGARVSMRKFDDGGGVLEPLGKASGGKGVRPRIEPEMHRSGRLEAPQSARQWTTAPTRGQLLRAKASNAMDWSHGAARVAGRNAASFAGKAGSAVARRPLTSLLAANVVATAAQHAFNSKETPAQRSAPAIAATIGGVIGGGIGRAFRAPGIGAALGANYGANKASEQVARGVGGRDFNSRHRRGQHGKFSKFDGGDVLEQLGKRSDGARPRMMGDTHMPDRPLVPTQKPTDRRVHSPLSDLPTSRQIALPKPGPGFTPHNAETDAVTSPTRGMAAPHPAEDTKLPNATLVPTQKPTQMQTGSSATKGPGKPRMASPQAGKGFVPHVGMKRRMSGKGNARKAWSMSSKAMR